MTIYLNERGAELLGLHPRKPDRRHALHRRHERSHQENLSAQDETDRRLYQTVRRDSLGLFRAIQQCGSSNPPGKTTEKMEARLEDSPHREGKSGLGRS